MAMVGQYGLSGNIGTFLNNAPKTQITPRPGGNNNIGGMLQNVIGLGESMYGQKIQDDRVNQIKGDWRDTIAAARPGNITGGNVDVNYDAGSNTLNVANNPQLQGLIASQYAQQGGLSEQLANLDPFALGNFLYEQGSGIRDQEQAQERNEILERLNATGMLSSSSGNQLQGQITQQQNLANAMERNQSIMQGQEVANAIASRENAAIGNIFNADTLTQNAIKNAISMGIDVPPPEYLNTAYQDAGDAKAETGSGLADLLGFAVNPIGGMLSKLF